MERLTRTRRNAGQTRRLVLVLMIAAATRASAQQPTGAASELMTAPGIRAALDFVRANEPRVLEDQVRLCEIPAPPFQEGQRALALKQLFEEAGLQRVRIDQVGNVLGEHPGLAGRPNVVLSAHLDTVFPPGTDVRVAREGAVLKGPGIGDDCRGLAVVLGVARALATTRIATAGTITVVGTVGEEGLGDLRGVRHLFGEELKGRIDQFVSVDGAGRDITHVGIGSRRYRIAYKGPGGHSYGAFGIANPIHALGRAIAAISDLDVPRQPKTTFSVGRVGGGTSVNSIAFEAWMEVDMRSADPATLAALEARVLRAAETALLEENRRWGGRGRLTLERELVGDRPAGRTDVRSPIVELAVSISTALSIPAGLDEGSTDANLPMSLGIPAITIEGGGTGSGAHSLDELFNSTGSW